MAKKKKTLLSRLASSVRICSRTWLLGYDVKMDGAQFTSLNDDGDGEITMGVSLKSPRHILNSLVHEIIEGVLTEDNKRWLENSGHDGSSDNHMFIFDHYYLSDRFVPGIVDAIDSVGIIDWNLVRKKLIP